MKLQNHVIALFALQVLTFGQLVPIHKQTQRSFLTPETAFSLKSITIRVDCNNARAPVRSIAAALKLLGNVHPATLLISGTCHEHVNIAGLDRITLQGRPSATIDGGTDPSFDAVDISDSQEIYINDLKITGGASGVVCTGQSLCRLVRLVVENSLGVGVSVNFRAHLSMVDSVVQNAADAGIFVLGGSIRIFGGSIVANGSDGIRVRNGGHLLASGSDLTPTATISNNGGNGIDANGHSTIGLNGGDVRGNAGDGVALQGSSELNMLSSNIINNTGHQVRIGPLGLAFFAGFQSNTVVGANPRDVACDPPFSATQRFSNLAGATTNCPEELQPTP